MTGHAGRVAGLALGAVLALGGGASAQHAHAEHGATRREAASTAQFRAANDAMHAGMALDFTGDADVDFARGMIPHHQGAIDMARVVLAHGADPALRRLAEDIIAAQEGEIAFLRDWLARNGH